MFVMAKLEEQNSGNQLTANKRNINRTREGIKALQDS